MNIKTVFEKQGNKIIARKNKKIISCVLAAALFLSVFAFALGGVFALPAPEEFNADATKPGYNVIVMPNTVNFAAGYVTTVNPRYTTDESVFTAGYTNRFTITPHKAGQADLVWASTQQYSVVFRAYWVKDNNNIASYAAPSKWYMEVARGAGFALDIDALDGYNAPANDKVKWISIAADVADIVSGAEAKAEDVNGMAYFIGTFTDIWGEEHLISMTVKVGKGVSGFHFPKWGGSSWIALDEPENVYVKVTDDGKVKMPLEFIYAPNGDDGDEVLEKVYHPVVVDNDGNFYVEYPEDSGEWYKIDENGELGDEPAFIKGSDGKYYRIVRKQPKPIIWEEVDKNGNPKDIFVGSDNSDKPDPEKPLYKINP
ncbi:MAG: hypothetical protein FWF08_01650, partial [Oscillospiraceae bacterium]|nr:hypothetical protein [Oscillospiraceae bacterium]